MAQSMRCYNILPYFSKLSYTIKNSFQIDQKKIIEQKNLASSSIIRHQRLS
jgi:hypothetical protein